MSIGRAIVALEGLSAADLEIVLGVGARLLARASEPVQERPEQRRSSAAERTRRWRERASQTVTETVTRDAQTVTGTVTGRHGDASQTVTERHGVTGVARVPSPDPSEHSPSVLKDRKPQSHLQSESDARTRDAVTGGRDAATRDASRVTGRDVTDAAESARRVIASAYRSRGLSVPRQVASLAATAETAAALAGLPADKLGGILERFFADHAMRAKGYPVAWLLTNANQWAIDGISRDDGAPRERPAETVLPDWMKEGAA